MSEVGADQPYRPDGKVALVTGGASGIGSATCREVTRAGAEVLVADRVIEHVDHLHEYFSIRCGFCAGGKAADAAGL